MKRLVVAVALLVAIAAGALALGWSQRVALAQWWLERDVAARGIEPAAFRVVSFETTGIAIEAVTAGDPAAPDLSVERVEADWTPESLFAGRFTALRVRGVVLRAHSGDAGLSLGALDPLLLGGAAVAGEVSLPAPEIALEDARVEVATARGPARGTLGGALHERDGAIEGAFTLDLAGAGIATRGRLALGGTLALPSFELALEPSDAGSVALDLKGRRVEGDALVLDASKLRVAGNTISVGSVRLGRDGEIALDATRVEIATPREAFAATIDGNVRAQEEGLDGRLAIDLTGKEIAAKGKVTLGGTLARPSLRARFDPLRVGSLALSLDARARLGERGVVAIERSTLSVAGGIFAIDAATFDPAAKRNALPLRVEKLDLAALLALATVEGLSGTGVVSGELPIVRDRDGFHVDAGQLRASGGTLRFEPSASVQNLAASRPGDLGIAVQAFSDFRYEVLEARVSGDLDGALAIALHVRGANPSFENGRTVELNLNLESHLLDLVRSGSAAYRVPERIEERVRQTQEGR